MKKIFGLALMLMLLVGVSSADPIHWTLSNVVFTDGGTATGYFDFDASNNSLSAWNISVSGGNTGTFPAMTYNTSNSSLFGAFSAFGDRVINIDSFGRQIRFAINESQVGTGGVANLDIANGYESECYNCSPFRALASGTVTGGSVPEPSSLALIALGSGALLRRRRRIA